MLSKARINYWIDVVIGISFFLSILSGIVLFLAPSGGYQGGRNPGYGQEVLFLGHHAWSDLHTWSSIIMAAGVLGHLVLHWSWITCMTKRIFRSKRGIEVAEVACPNTSV